MSKKVTIAENALEPSTWVEYETENILDFLVNHFESWPENARIYNGSVSEIYDVTPENDYDIKKLSEMEGPFFVVVYPGEAFTVITLVISLISLAIVIFNKPKIPTVASRTGESQSTNNALSDRTNKARINGRIPDIYGQVRSVPDLLAQPYKYFDNNIEFEHSFMCVGKGNFVFEDIREDTTLISDIEGSSVEIFKPFTSPNSGDAPQVRIGESIGLPIKNVTRSSSVASQVMGPDSAATISLVEVKFTVDSKIVAKPGSTVDFRVLFSIGGTVKVTGAILYAWETPNPDRPSDFVPTVAYDLDGTYDITAVSQYEITVSNASSNTDWAGLIALPEDSVYLTPNLISNAALWAGPYIITKTDCEEIWCNFVSQNGIYKDDGATRTAFPVIVTLGITPVDSTDTPIGTEEFFDGLLLWDYRDNLDLGVTVKAKPTFTGRMSIRARRVTPSAVGAGYQTYEEVRWRDLYIISAVNQLDFGNVTTVQSLVKAMPDSKAVTDRKLNMLATRKLPTRISGTTFSEELYPTKYADDIIAAICLDPFIGNRQVSEIDLNNLYNTIEEIIAYFGTDYAAEFCYTFDSTNLSFEEILSSVANAIFCVAYRRGNQIKFHFEKINEVSTILFNHRNKIPGSENRTISFGNANENDGVEYQYINPDDDTVKRVYLPFDQSAANPVQVESIGVRNYAQAYFNAQRLYNKLRYQTTTVEFEGTQEAAVCVVGERILVSDGTRQGSLEGEILSQNVLELTLSQDVNLLDGVDYTIFLQHKDGSVESMPITKTSTKNKVILSQAPISALALDADLFARATFIITDNNDPRRSAFILTEKSPKSVMTSNLKAVNYDERYYQADNDFGDLTVAEDLYTRKQITVTTGTLADSASENIDIAIDKIAYIRRVTTNANAKVELFPTAADRTAGTNKTFDITTNGVYHCNPIPVFINGDTPVADIGYLKVTNLSGSSRLITVIIDYVKYTSWFYPGVDIIFETHINNVYGVMPVHHASTHLAGGTDPILWATVHGKGTTAAKPAPGPTNNGYIYFDTDLNQLQRSNGTAWENIGSSGSGGSGNNYYDIPCSIPGYPAESQIMLMVVAVRAFTVAATGHKIKALTLPTNAASFPCKKNGTTFGTITLETDGAIILTGFSETTFVIGDYLTVESPSISDATMQDIGITLIGVS